MQQTQAASTNQRFLFTIPANIISHNQRDAHHTGDNILASRCLRPMIEPADGLSLMFAQMISDKKFIDKKDAIEGETLHDFTHWGGPDFTDSSVLTRTKRVQERGRLVKRQCVFTHCLG